jgi:hypothetical protein
MNQLHVCRKTFDLSLGLGIDAEPLGRFRDTVHTPKKRVALRFFNSVKSRGILCSGYSGTERKARSAVMATISGREEPEPASRAAFSGNSVGLNAPIDVIRIIADIGHLELRVVV